jgi:hypothetical protein
MSRRTHRNVRALGFLAVTLTLQTAGATLLSGQAPRTVDRDLFVSVLTNAGAPATGLAPGDFVVREDDLVREVLRARRATDPIDLTILIDNSQAAGAAILDLRRALEAFTATMADHGRVALIGVADRPTILTESTNDKALLLKGVQRVFAMPGSGATVLEGIDEVLAGLKKREAERAALLVIWLGAPEFSNIGHLKVLQDLQAGGAALHVLTVGPGVPRDAATPEGRDREVVFDQGSRDTGGRRTNELSPMSLKDALDQLAAELTNQYRITYARPDSLIPPNKVEVSVRPPGLTARGTPVRTVKRPPTTP